MEEILTKTHLIVTSVRDEYHLNWRGKIVDTKPLLNADNLPKFVIIGSKGRIETNTTNLKMLERYAKSLTSPKGRSTISVDNAHIYIVEVDGTEKCLGVLTHRRIKTFASIEDN